MIPKIVAQKPVDILPYYPLQTLPGVTKLSERVLQLANETTFKS